MKKLTDEERQNMTLEDAWDITQEFGAFVAKVGYNPQYEFEDLLPYKKTDILLALLKVLVDLKEEDTDPDSGTLEEIKENTSTLIVLLDGFIPNKEQYKQMLSTKKLLDEKFGHRFKKEKGEVEDVDNRESFKDNLLAIANGVLKNTGLPESDDIEDAAVIVLTHIASLVLSKAGHAPVEGRTEESDMIIGVTFLCFLGMPLCLNIKDEDTTLSLNDVIARAGLAIFTFLKSEKKAAETIHKGIAHYNEIIQAGKKDEKIEKYVNTTSDVMILYIMTKDEKLIDTFHSIYMTLFNAH